MFRRTRYKLLLDLLDLTSTYVLKSSSIREMPDFCPQYCLESYQYTDLSLFAKPSVFTMTGESSDLCLLDDKHLFKSAHRH